MIPGIIILIVMILIVVFLNKRVKQARQAFDDIQTNDTVNEQEQDTPADQSGSENK